MRRRGGCCCRLGRSLTGACAQGRWLPELRRIVGVINDSFSLNFREIGCAGEVSLGVNGAPCLPLRRRTADGAGCSACSCQRGPAPLQVIRLCHRHGDVGR